MKKQKILFMFLLFLIIILINVSSFAAVGNGFFEGKINPDGDTSGIFKVGDSIISLAQVIGVGMAVISTFVLGIRYMYSSPGEKADIKSKMIPWVIGGVLIFGATTIVKLIEMVVHIK